jgi:two-component system, LytTR family, sensor histidine kinase AlgZ
MTQVETENRRWPTARRTMQTTQSNVTSIKQTPERSSPEAVRCLVPDFRNLGALLRVLLFANLLGLLTALVRAPSLPLVGHEFVLIAHRMELPLFAFVMLLYALGSWLMHLGWRDLTLMVCSLALMLVITSQSLLFRPDSPDAFLRGILWTLGAVLGLMAYFRWRQISRMPALGEARILALTARIRPHFFFNSLNGVLGVMRSDPKRAEIALESLAELFRELMRDSRDLVTLCDEIELCNRYLDLERLRLGDRLQVKWELKYAPLNAKVPPLMLQPLIENAVYHGIEPGTEPGLIFVRIVRRGQILEMNITNPALHAVRRVSGNRMALNNIRERLALFFDMEANLTTEEKDGEFKVRIRMPLRREGK